MQRPEAAGIVHAAYRHRHRMELSSFIRYMAMAMAMYYSPPLADGPLKFSEHFNYTNLK